MVVVIADAEFTDLSWEEEFLGKHGLKLIVGHCRKPNDLISIACDADAIIVNRCPITQDVLEKLRHCKVIVRYGVGIDNVDVEAATMKGVIVCNIPGFGTNEVATHAVALLLSCWRFIYVGNEGLKQGKWLSYTCIAPVHATFGRIVGLFGFGNIARRVTELIYSFGFKVIAYDPYVSDENMLLYGVEKVSLRDLLKSSDAISLHSPLTYETKNIFNRDVFSQMKKGMVFVNTARGGLVDEQALLWALDEGIIAAAGLDVFINEPDPNPELIKHPKVVATPHWAWYSEEAMWKLRHQTVEQVIQVLQGQKPYHALNWDEVHQTRS